MQLGRFSVHLGMLPVRRGGLLPRPHHLLPERNGVRHQGGLVHQQAQSHGEETQGQYCMLLTLVFVIHMYSDSEKLEKVPCHPRHVVGGCLLKGDIVQLQRV